jgi:hypothetical protein
MAFSAWSENDPAGSDAASSINEAATRAAVRLRERLATVYPDFTTATDRIHLEKIFLKATNGLTIRDDGDTVTHATISDGGIFTFSKQPACRLSKASTFTTTANTFVAIPFDTEKFDIGAMHDPANNTKVTIPTAAGGLYLWQFVGDILWPGTAANLNVIFKIRKGGATDEIIFPTDSQTVSVAADPLINNQSVSFSTIISAAAADYFEMFVQSNGFAYSLTPHLSVYKLA